MEASGQGAHFSNIMDGEFPLLIPMVMLPVDIVLYFILTLYLDSVVPGTVDHTFFLGDFLPNERIIFLAKLRKFRDLMFLADF